MPQIPNRNLLRMVAYGTTLAGFILLALQVIDLSRYSFLDGTVTSLTPYSGKCRLRMGKYIDCERIRGEVQYQSAADGSERLASIELGERATTPSQGSRIKIMVREDDPKSARLASISRGWSVPLGILVLGLLLCTVYFAGRSRRADGASTNSSSC